MELTFDSLPEEQLQEINLIPKGTYSFEVMKAEFKISKAGNSKIDLTLKIFLSDGKEKIVFDSLVKHEKMLYKIKHFCDATGLEEAYKIGKLKADLCVGKTGMLSLDIDPAKTGPNGEQYNAKNVVKDYIKRNFDQGSLTTPAKAKKDDLNDDIPF